MIFVWPINIKKFQTCPEWWMFFLFDSPNIEFIDTPDDIRDKYQYFTEANMSKLISIGYNNKFYSLEEGISDYVKEYLLQGRYL